MSKTIKTVVSLLLVIVMLASVCLTAISCKDKPKDDDNTAVKKNYTYKGYTSALATNWNPHSWENNSDQAVLGYIEAPFVDMSILNSKDGVYQWVYEMATEVKDVTAEHQDDLTKYGVTLGDKKAEDVKEGFVFEIKLNPEAKWQNGEKINADTYVESMKRLLDPKMRNYRANLYIAGENAIAGANGFYNSEAPIYAVVVPAYGEDETPDYTFDVTKQPIFINPTSKDMTISAYSIGELADMGIVDGALYTKIANTANAFGFVKITNDNKADVLAIMDQYLSGFGLSIYKDADKKEVNEDMFKEFLFYDTGKKGDKVEYDKVGMYKVDDYTIRYVTQTYIGFNYFLTSLTSNWIVYVPLYDKLKDTSGELVTTKYGSSVETTMAYGAYKLESLQSDKQMVFVQNENWYGYTKDEAGNLVSYTNFDVDGEKRQQYKTTKVIIDVMDDAQAKQAFLKGELSEWAPTSDELSTYSYSDQLYKVDETFTLSFFFNTGIDALKAMDASKGNKNSVVLSNEDFRKAFSLAIDRNEFVTATQGYKPAFSLMNSLYYYDIYDDDKDDGVAGPNTNYRLSEEAMQAIVNLYGVKYGEGEEAYKTLREAHDSITGYNLTEAKKLMKQACDKLVADGLYKKGEEIKIKIGWAKGALKSDDNKQVALMNKYINNAIEGSGFGKITLEAIGNIDNRYAAVPNGEYAIGLGAWGGAAFYPFRNFQVYMDPDQYEINEAGCYDPKTEKLTLKVDGKDVEMTWQEWSNALIGAGKYASADTKTKLSITAQLEEAFLKTYYRIPLCGTTVCSMLSYQCKNYTENYNIMYGFGGFRLTDYTYTDEEWAKFVEEQVKENGEIDYQ